MGRPVDRICLWDDDATAWEEAAAAIGRLASHVDVVARWASAEALAALLAGAISANPAALLDCYMLADTPPEPADLSAWRSALPYRPGYLDRVAVYRSSAPHPPHDRVSPRLWLVLPWTAQADPAAYQGVAEIIWAYDMAEGEEPPLAAWLSAGGAGVWVRGRSSAEVAAWRARAGVRLWA